jgi:23S rRNA G2445 N2-methylase RlmL
VDQKHEARLFAIVSPGLEAVCARELGELAANDLEVTSGGVSFTGRLADLYRS